MHIGFVGKASLLWIHILSGDVCVDAAWSIMVFRQLEIMGVDCRLKGKYKYWTKCTWGMTTPVSCHQLSASIPTLTTWQQKPVHMPLAKGFCVSQSFGFQSDGKLKDQFADQRTQQMPSFATDHKTSTNSFFARTPKEWAKAGAYIWSRTQSLLYSRHQITPSFALWVRRPLRTQMFSFSRQWTGSWQ